MNLKKFNLLKKIATPFIIILFSGFVGVLHFKDFINELHKKAKKEKRNNVWFTKKAILLYLHITFLFFVNFSAWSLIGYFIFG